MGNTRIVSCSDFFQKSERRKRISVDIDDKQRGPLTVVQSFFTLKRLLPDCQVIVNRTRHGHHVKAVGESIELIPFEKRIELREQLLDDPYRIECDRYKLKYHMQELTDTLFTMKRNLQGERGIVENVNILAHPWYSRLPAQKPTSRQVCRDYHP